jgi:hypothetical protein
MNATHNHIPASRLFRALASAIGVVIGLLRRL